MAIQIGGTYGAQFEAYVINLLVFDRDFAMDFSHKLNGDLFEQETHQDLAYLIGELRDNLGRPPTYPIIKAEFRSRLTKAAQKSPRRKRLVRAAKKLVEIKNLKPHKQEREYVRDKLKQFVLRGDIRSALHTALDHYDAESYDKIPQVVNKVFADQVQDDEVIDFLSVAQKAELYKQRNTASGACPIGWKTLDQHMRGGIECGTLGIFQGPPGRGKSLVLVNAGVSGVRQGLGVLHVTLELSKTDVALRYEARTLGIPVNTLHSNADQYAKNMREKAHAYFALGGRLFIKQYPPKGASVADIDGLIAKLEQTYDIKIGMLVVDYVDILGSSSRSEDRWERHGDTIQELKALAVRRQLRVWTAGQTTKSSFNSPKITLADGSDTVEKSRVADVMFGLCQTDNEKKTGRMRVVILKNRQGGHEGESITCEVDTSTMTISEAKMQSVVHTGGSKHGKP